MAKKKFGLATIIGLAVVLSSIAIGDAMRVGALAVPFVGLMVNQITGWVVIAGGILGALDIFGVKIL